MVDTWSLWSSFTNALDETADSLGRTAADVSSWSGGVANEVAGYASIAASAAADRFSGLRTTFANVGAPPPSPSVADSGWFNTRWGRRILTVLAFGSAGAAVYYIASSRRTDRGAGRRKRRFARAAPDGGRSEVVLLVGSPAEPLAIMIAQDLNVRGFIVYMTSTPEEQDWVAAEKSSDIRPLLMNGTDPQSVRHAIAELDRVLKTPVATLAGATPHRLTLAAVLLLPDLYYPAGPLETMQPHVVASIVYNKILMPLTVLSGGLIDLTRRAGSRIVLITPSIMGVLNPGFHTFESMATAALAALALSLSRELQPQGLPLSHVKLGSFDTGHSASHQQQLVRNMRADILSWPDNVRPFYASAYTGSARLQTTRTQGTKPARLHSALFDVITMPHPPRVLHIGAGSYIYELLSRVLPERVLSLALTCASSAPEDL